MLEDELEDFFEFGGVELNLENGVEVEGTLDAAEFHFGMMGSVGCVLHYTV